jgi:thymidylate synthase ThyX
MSQFTEEQIKILENYVSNTSKNVFVLRNLPEVIKGALFSRYSRSSLGLRSLLLKEFILNEDTAFKAIAGSFKEPENDQITAIKKAQNFYDRILDGYGDDSIGELGGAHLAFENISMIAAKVLEDSRIGGSPLEKSTRYIYFDQKVDGEYLFYKEPILMTSAYRDNYLETCNTLFETYSKLIPPLTALIEEKFPKEHHISKPAYTAALRAKVLDCLRGILPSSALTNVGFFGNGRFFENLLQKLNCHNLAELQELGKIAFEELNKTIPSFVRRANTSNKYFESYSRFTEEMRKDFKILSQTHKEKIKSEKNSGVFLIDFDGDSLYKVAGALLFENSNSSLEDLEEHCKTLPKEELFRILDAASLSRGNRRHKSPRALELANFTFEIIADFGIYRDLQRHRILTQGRQFLSCDLGYFTPVEIINTDMEKEYRNAMQMAKNTYDLIAAEFPEEAQYIVPMAYNIRWFFHMNLRSLQWLCELRSSPAGHPNYRYVAQEMARLVCEKVPEFRRFFKFVDFDGHKLGRIKEEVRKEEKAKRF